jgi:hypothetical protein
MHNTSSETKQTEHLSFIRTNECTITLQHFVAVQKKLSYSDIRRSRWETATDIICRQGCDTLLHVVYTLQYSREVRQRLDAELFCIATGAVLVVYCFPSKRQVGVEGGHATYWKLVENDGEGYDRGFEKGRLKGESVEWLSDCGQLPSIDISVIT